MEPDRRTHHEHPQVEYAECGNCRYFWHDREESGEDDLGECRRYPPSYVLDHGTPDEFFYCPSVTKGFWCGEHSERTA